MLTSQYGVPFDAKERQDSVLEKQAVKRHEKKDALLKRTRKADMHMLRYKLAQEGNMTIDPGVQFNRRLILRGTPPLPDAAAAAAAATQDNPLGAAADGGLAAGEDNAEDMDDLFFEEVDIDEDDVLPDGFYAEGPDDGPAGGPDDGEGDAENGGGSDAVQNAAGVDAAAADERDAQAEEDEQEGQGDDNDPAFDPHDTVAHAEDMAARLAQQKVVAIEQEQGEINRGAESIRFISTDSDTTFPAPLVYGEGEGAVKLSNHSTELTTVFLWTRYVASSKLAFVVADPGARGGSFGVLVTASDVRVWVCSNADKTLKFNLRRAPTMIGTGRRTSRSDPKGKGMMRPVTIIVAAKNDEQMRRLNSLMSHMCNLNMIWNDTQATTEAIYQQKKQERHHDDGGAAGEEEAGENRVKSVITKAKEALINKAKTMAIDTSVVLLKRLVAYEEASVEPAYHWGWFFWACPFVRSHGRALHFIGCHRTLTKGKLVVVDLSRLSDGTYRGEREHEHCDCALVAGQPVCYDNGDKVEGDDLESLMSGIYPDWDAAAEAALVLAEQQPQQEQPQEEEAAAQLAAAATAAATVAVGTAAVQPPQVLAPVVVGYEAAAEAVAPPVAPLPIVPAVPTCRGVGCICSKRVKTIKNRILRGVCKPCTCKAVAQCVEEVVAMRAKAGETGSEPAWLKQAKDFVADGVGGVGKHRTRFAKTLFMARLELLAILNRERQAAEAAPLPNGAGAGAGGQ